MRSNGAQQGGKVGSSPDRTILGGSEEKLFKLVSETATPEQWAELLRPFLEHAAAAGETALALDLLKAGANGSAGWKGCNDRSLLDAAAVGGSDEVVNALVEAGSRSDLYIVSGKDKMSALHRAIAGGHTVAARELLLAGADVRLLDTKKRTALHYALEGGHQALAGDVIIAGADLNAKDDNGDRPLHLAASQGADKVVRTLVCSRKVSVSVANKNGCLPLHEAIRKDHIAVAQTLLAAGADPNARYGKKNICSPLYLAGFKPAMTRILIQHGANVNAVDGDGYTALHWAATASSSEGSSTAVMDTLVEAGADIDARTLGVSTTRQTQAFSFRGLTPLHLVTWFANVDCMAVLLRKGADVNAKSDNGRSPLHMVCTAITTSTETLSTEVADLLLRWGADETATDNDGRTAQECIDSTAVDSAGPFHRVLTNARADRAWRRWGLLALCRAQPDKVLCRRACGGGNATSADDGGDDGVLTRLVRLKADIFREIMGFL